MANSWLAACGRVAVVLATVVATGVCWQSRQASAQDAAREADVQAIAVEHRDAAGLADQIRVLLGAGRAGGVYVSPASNEILVRGGVAERQLVAQIVAKLDQPIARPAPTPPRLEAYAVPAAQRAVARQWVESFRGAAEERAAWDDRTGQLILFASDAVHASVGQLLRTGAAPASPTAESQTNRPRPAEVVRLLTLAPDELHGRIEKIIARPIPATWDADGRWLTFPVQLGATPDVTLRIDARGRTVEVQGNVEAAAAWRQVIAAMDGAGEDERATQIVTASRSRRPTIRRALAALGNQPAAGAKARPVTMLLQPDGKGDGATGQTPTDRTEAPQPATAMEPAGGDSSLLGPVQVEFVEGLDIIVLRGSDRDVARVMEIINQIEELSQVTVPTIEILPLKHVDSVPMAALLARVYQQVLGPRTGSVSITALGKPNSLLLIGREDNVRRAIDLATQLDQPATPTARFEVFSLRHAVASDAKQLIDEYLEEADGDDEDASPALAPTATVIADFRSNSLIVSASPRELDEIRSIVERIDVAQSAAVDEVRIFPLRNSLAADLADVLRTAISQSGEEAAGEGVSAPRSAMLRFVTIDRESRQRLESGIVTSVRIAPDERANSLIVSAPADSMDLIAALIDQLDRAPDSEAELKVFTIANGDAVALEEMLSALFNTDEDDPDAGGLGAAANSLVRMQFTVDERTNSIIAAGSAEDLDVVYAILTRLDGADTRQRVNRVFRLNNAYAVNVAETLTEWLDQRSEAEQDAELSISPFEQIDREVIIAADEASNSLIISATPRYYEQMEDLIRQLDEQPPMVTVQVLIAEVRLNDTDEFGIELGLQDSLLFDRSLVGELRTITNSVQENIGGAVVTNTEQVIIDGPLTPGFNFNDVNNPLGSNGSNAALAGAGTVAAQGLVNFGVGRANQALGFGGFVLAASSNSIDSLLRALQENRRLEVLSRPQITMLDGQFGSISVGQSVPRIQGVSIDQLGRQSNQLTDVDVGIILEVTPRISPDGQVVMQVRAVRSEVGNEAEGTPVFVGDGGTVIRSPAINQTVADTTVMAASGQTIVLSGLLTKSTFDVHRSVPLLSDIPLLGDLFRYDSVSEERTELLIIMTPRVIRSEQDAEMLKQIESSRMSWVLGDVVTMHGPSGLRSRNDEWGAGECEVVYPTFNPVEAGAAQPFPMQSAPVEGVPVDDGNGPALMEPENWSPDVLPPPPVGAAAEGAEVKPVGYRAIGSRFVTPAVGQGINRLPPVE